MTADISSPSKPQATGRLQGRRIIVTGGASGIGRSVASLFIQEGARISVFDRNDAALQIVARESGALAIKCDVKEEQSVVAAVEQAAQALGGVDGLVNAAGIALPLGLMDTDTEQWRHVIDVNLTGTYLMCRATIPKLRASHGATIVNVASAAGLLPTGPRSAAYVASKGGVISLTKALAIELAPDIRVNVVCPGTIDTPMTAASIRDDAGRIRSALTEKYALGRVGSADEVARAVLFMTGGDLSFVTGVALAVDGGRTFH